MELLENSSDSKFAFLQDIDNEIQREYAILNKFTTEKFSIILLILGIGGIIATMWNPMQPHFDLNEFLGYWILSTFMMLIIWMISVCNTLNAVRKGRPGPTITIDFILRKFHELINAEEFKKFLSTDKTENKVDEGNLKIYLQKIANFIFVNTDYIAKNTETRMRPIAFFFFFLLFIAIAIFENYFGITIPQIQQTTPILPITLFWGIVVYAVLFTALGFYWNYLFFIGKNIIKPFGWGIQLIFTPNENQIQKWLLRGLGSIIILFYVVLLLVLIAFLIIFPFVVDYCLIIYYSSFEISNVVVKFLLVFLLVYLFFKIFEILFSIHLVERLKNDKITWLKQIKYDLLVVENVDSEILEKTETKIKLADIYSPIPYTSLAAFTRYEIIPIYRYDVTSELIQQRLEFLNKH